MAAEAKGAERIKRKRPCLKLEVKGAGGILVLGGAIVVAAFAAYRAWMRRERGAAAGSGTAQVEKKREESRVLDSGGVADGAQHLDGRRLKEQLSLKAADDVEESKDVLEKKDLVFHEDGTLGVSDDCLVAEKETGCMQSEESELSLDATKFSDVAGYVKEDASSESSVKQPCNQMQVILHGLQIVNEDISATGSHHFHMSQYRPDFRIEETKAVHLAEMEEKLAEEWPQSEPFEQVEDSSDEEEAEMNDEESDVSDVHSPSSESSAEPIWPAEVIEQEKGVVVSAELMHDVSEEVKNMIHIEDSERSITDATLKIKAASEGVKQKKKTGMIPVSRNNSKGLLLGLLLLLLLAMATALGLVSLVDKEHLLTISCLTEFCKKFFHTIFASSHNIYEF